MTLEELSDLADELDDLYYGPLTDEQVRSFILGISLRLKEQIWNEIQQEQR